jgi:hypothetical protein
MRSPAVFPSMGKGPSLLMVIDGFLPGVTQLEDSGVVTQCVACEYAGCICIVVVIIVIPNASAITAKVIVMANFCINN